MMLNVFQKRKILNRSDARAFKEPRYVFDRLKVDVSHSIDDISRSRAAAYRYLDDNRENLFIPANRDFIIADLYDANKVTRQGLRVPRQIILEYIWREEIILKGRKFGQYEGEVTNMLCGGTLVFDENGNVLSWFRKPCIEQYGRPFTSDRRETQWNDECAEGRKRQKKFLDDLARRINAGHVGAMIGSGKGLLGTHVPPLTAEKQDGILRFNLSPHMHLAGEDQDHFEGGPQWEVSS
jgi:hypothetical protein